MGGRNLNELWSQPYSKDNAVMIQIGSIFVYLFWIFGSLVVLFLVLLVFGSLYFKWYFSWELSHRRGLNYYSRPLEYRRDFRKKIKIHAFFLQPFIWIEAKLRKAKGTYEFASIKYKDVYGPSFSCSQESFQKAADYQPSARDIFVVAQMRCGTTWMLQLIFQILTKGNGRFNDSGYVHLCAISPWLESLDNVSTEKAPLIGSSFKKIIKTHLPAGLCPYNETAKYIYIIRHPVSCFQSIIDYFQLTTGPFVPPVSKVFKWYCSNRMWWLSWPDHVVGWWEQSQKKNNILFVQFEEMKKDLSDVVERISRFLEEDLTGLEIQNILTHSSFQYMKENEEYFEMIPPNLFSVAGTYFKSGEIDRYKNVPDEIREKILSFCGQRLKNTSYPVEKFYSDITTAFY